MWILVVLGDNNMNIIYPEDILYIFIQKGKHVLPLRSNDYLVDKFNFYSRNIGYILSEYYVWNLARG
jgi:hypothetical protein